MTFEDDFWKEFVTHIQDRWGTIWPSAELLGQGVLCFGAGAYFASCVMCRASVEALFHLARTNEGRHSTLKPYASWGELESWASKKGLLKGLKRKVDRVRNSGNFAAHLAQKIHEGYVRMYSKKPSRSTRGILLRLDKETALNRLLETSEIITKVTERRWPYI